MSNKTFTLSKDGLNNLKTVLGVFGTVQLKRKMFVCNIGKSRYILINNNDIPDDFEMNVHDLSSFIGTYNMIDNAVIDYTSLDDNNYIDIVNTNGKETMQCIAQSFTLDGTDKNDTGGNIDPDYANNFGRESENGNNFTLSKDELNKLFKAVRMTGADKILVSPISDTEIRMVVNADSVSENKNTYTLDIENAEIKDKNLEFHLFAESFMILDKSADSHEVAYGGQRKKKGTIIRFVPDNELYSIFLSSMI